MLEVGSHRGFQVTVRRRGRLRLKLKTKKPSTEAGLFVCDVAFTNGVRRHPAKLGGNGRRAREVIPAAIQAEVKTSASA
ncbi:hypothetical protein GCM10028795_25980 [Lysobacter olei]